MAGRVCAFKRRADSSIPADGCINTARTFVLSGVLWGACGSGSCLQLRYFVFFCHPAVVSSVGSCVFIYLQASCDTKGHILFLGFPAHENNNFGSCVPFEVGAINEVNGMIRQR